MNGQDLLEALSFVDEKYIAESEQPAARRIYWQPIAAMAACAALVVWFAWPKSQPLSLQKSVDAPMLAAAPSMEMAIEEEAMDTSAANDFAIMRASLLAEMTVTVTRIEDGIAHCQVLDAGSSPYQPGDTLQISLEDWEISEGDYRVIFSPDDAQTIHPAAMEPVGEAAE